MHQVTMKAWKREETGKQACKRARNEGKIPGVIYGKEMNSILINVDTKEFKKAIHSQAGTRVIINLEMQNGGKGETYTTMVAEFQKDIYQKYFFHVDFRQIHLDKKVRAEVPVILKGESVGVKSGGLLDHQLWSIRVESYPLDLPERVEIDITPMKEGSRVTVGELDLGEKVTVLESPDAPVVIVHAPRVAQTAEGAAAGEPAGAAS